MVRIRGSYALAIMFKDYPGEIYVARKDSPMILGVENGESYIASDVPAILKIHQKCILYWKSGDGSYQKRGDHVLQSGW